MWIERGGGRGSGDGGGSVDGGAHETEENIQAKIISASLPSRFAGFFAFGPFCYMVVFFSFCRKVV